MPVATHGVSLAQQSKRGCTYPDADNYDAEAVWDDGSCVYQGAGSCPKSQPAYGVQDILLLLGAFGSECTTTQSNMLLIGNSFFRPYAENLDVVAVDAGHLDHSSTTVFRAVTMTCEQFLGHPPAKPSIERLGSGVGCSL